MTTHIPKKSLGQNFLTSVGAINKIIDSSDYSPDLTILEVGPGRGVLTEALLKKFDKVVAVEKDHELIAVLQDKFAKEISSGQLKIIEGDILELTPAVIARHEAISNPIATRDCFVVKTPRNDGTTNYAVVANIPYYITGQFLRVWLQNKPKYMVLMVQKEVAKRIVARDKKESLLSISVKIYGRPENIETIKRGSFYPIPNVDSAILKITLHLEAKLPSKLDEERFFTLLRAGFAHKRKLLSNNLLELGDTTSYGRTDLQALFTSCKIDPKTRAEDLVVEDWRCLAGSVIARP